MKFHGNRALRFVQRIIMGNSSVCPFRKNGFTLIEVMVSMAVILFIASMLPLLFRLLGATSEQTYTVQEREWDVFIIQLNEELRGTELLKVEDQLVSWVNTQNETVSVSLYQDRLRRRVDGKGHEVVLLSVQSVLFTRSDHGFMIEVVRPDGETDRAMLFP